MFLTAFAMRSDRLLFTSALLISYLLLAVGAEPLHLWQEGGCGDACHAGHTLTLTHAHDAVGDHCEEAEHGSQESEDSAPHREQHDSSECFVCQVLGQAQDKVIPASLTFSDEVFAAAPLALPDFSPEPCSKGFHGRAPPAV